MMNHPSFYLTPAYRKSSGVVENTLLIAPIFVPQNRPSEEPKWSQCSTAFRLLIRDQLLHVQPLTGWMCARTASNRHDQLQTEDPWPYAKGVNGDAALHHSEDESRANSCANSCDRTLGAITTSADQQSRQPASPYVISDFISGQGEKKSKSHTQDEGR